MTESDWVSSSDLEAMLRFVRHRASPRKLRLFACACCRLYWDLLPHDKCREAVELGEQYADDSLDEAQREAAYRELNRLLATERGLSARLGQATSCLLRPRFSPALVAERARTGGRYFHIKFRQADLLRDLVGSPFRCPTLASAVRAANGGTIEGVARAIYEERRFEDLPLLADALEDAGCSDTALLDHCRQQGHHVFGCWAVDLALGRID